MSEYKKKVKSRQSEDVEAAIEVPEVAEELNSEVDDLLDEIDSVLEENAEEFVSDYVQRGGQ